MRAQRVASRLLVELCGARARARDDRRRGRDRPPARRSALRGARCDSLLGIQSSARGRTRLPRAGSGSTCRGRTASETSSRRCPSHRHYDVTREVDLIEEVGRLHGFDEHLPRDPAGDRRPASAACSAEQALRRRAEDVLRDLGFDEVDHLELRRSGLADRLRLADRDPRRPRSRSHNPLSVEHSRDAHRRCSAACSTSPATTSPAAPSGSPCSSPAASTCPQTPPAEAGGPLGGRFAGPRPPPAARAAPDRRAPGRPSWRRRSWRRRARRRRTSSTLKGAARGPRGPLGVEVALEAAARAVPAPGARGARVRGRHRGRLARRAAPARPRASWDLPAARRRSRSTLAPLVAASRPPARSATRTSPPIPPSLQDLAVVVAERRAAPSASARRCWRAAASCSARRRRSSTSTDGEQVGDGQQEPRAAARVPGARPDAHRRRGGRAAAAGVAGRSSDRDRRARSVSERDAAARRRARGAGPGRRGLGLRRRARRRARLAPSAPRARRGDRARRRRQPARRPLSAPPGADRADASSTSTRVEDCRRGDRRLSARRLGARRRRRCAGSGSRSSTSRPTSGSATPTSIEQWYGEHGDARAARRRRLRAARARPRADPRAPSWSPTPAAIRPRRCWRWRRSPRRGLIDDVVDRRQVGRLRGRAGRGRATQLRERDRELRAPTGSAAIATSPRSSRSWPARAGGTARRRSPSCRTCCRSTRACWRAATCDLDRDARGRGARRALRERYDDEPFVEVVDGAAGRARRARHEPLPDSRRPRRRGRAARVRARSTTSGRGPPARRSRT